MPVVMLAGEILDISDPVSQLELASVLAAV